LLITGTTALEEWLETSNLDFGGNNTFENHDDSPDIGMESKLDMQTRMDQLFSDTLTEMGVLHGEIQ